MNLNQVFSGDYLKAEDLQGRTVPVIISKVELKQFEDGNKLVLHFEGKNKQLVANKTNANIIAENTGTSETDNWVGKRISLYVKKVEFQGKLVPAIRVVLNDTPAPAPVRPAPAPARQPDPARDDEGFAAANPEEGDPSVPF